MIRCGLDECGAVIIPGDVSDDLGEAAEAVSAHFLLNGGES